MCRAGVSCSGAVTVEPVGDQVLNLSMAKESANFVIFILAGLLTAILPSAFAQTGDQLDARNQIVISVLGQEARPRQLSEATARLGEIEAALQTFLAQG